MQTRIVDRDAFTLVGHSARVRLQHEGANPEILEFVSSLPPTEHERLKGLSSGEPAGLLQVSMDLDGDRTEGTELTYLHGVVAEPGPGTEDLAVVEVPAGTWAVFTATGNFPLVLQETWAATATEWFPSQPWRLVQGPEMVAILDRATDFSTATCELWLPVEPA